MRVRSLRIDSVRNLRATTIEPGFGFNVFAGNNGQGKTNLIEALYTVATLRSFRTRHLRDLIAFDQAQALIQARVEQVGLVSDFDLRIGAKSRVIRRNGKHIRNVRAYFGGFNVVLFSPEDLRIVRASPGDRRRFLDRSVFAGDPAHLTTMREYESALKSRNAVLRKMAERGRIDPEMLAVYDTELARYGARVVKARQQFLRLLQPWYQEAYRAISGGEGEVRLEQQWAADELKGVDSEDQVEVREVLAAALAERRGRDARTMTTSVGPHRDDLLLEFNGRSAGGFASQGQMRSMILAWKIAETRWVEELVGESPLVLLDDVTSELDAGRNRHLFAFLANRTAQCFITTTDSRHILLPDRRQDYEVSDGVLTCQSSPPVRDSA